MTTQEIIDKLHSDLQLMAANGPGRIQFLSVTIGWADCYEDGRHIRYSVPDWDETSLGSHNVELMYRQWYDSEEI